MANETLSPLTQEIEKIKADVFRMREFRDVNFSDPSVDLDVVKEAFCHILVAAFSNDLVKSFIYLLPPHQDVLNFFAKTLGKPFDPTQYSYKSEPRNCLSPEDLKTALSSIIDQPKKYKFDQEIVYTQDFEALIKRLGI